MNSTIYKKNLRTFIAWILMTCMEMMVYEHLSYNRNSLALIAGIAIATFLLQTFSCKVCNIPLLSFFFAFLTFLYLFHFGQAITAGYFYDVAFQSPNYILKYADDKAALWKALQISQISINMVFMGGLLSADYIRTDRKSAAVQSTHAYRTCYILGRFLFGISFPFKLFTDIRQMTAAISSGYEGARSIKSIGGVFGAVASFWYLSIIFIYFTLDTNKKKKGFLGLCLIYISITMLTGNRGHQITNIIAIFLVVYDQSNKKFGLYRLFKACVLGLAVLMFLNMIFEMRAYGLTYVFEHSSHFFRNLSGNNVILDTIHNFGATIFTPYLVVKDYGTVYKPFFAETYMKSLVSVIPDAFHIFYKINNEANLGRSLQTSHAIGGSFIGELYYNFGHFYFLGAFIFGWIYSRLSSNIFLAARVLDYDTLCKTVPFMAYSFWWIRDSAAGLTRPVVWVMLIYVVISKRSTRFDSKFR